MAKHKQPCLICGRLFDYYDAAPRGFCSVGCEADAGEPLADLYARRAKRADSPLPLSSTQAPGLPDANLTPPGAHDAAEE